VKCGRFSFSARTDRRRPRRTQARFDGSHCIIYTVASATAIDRSTDRPALQESIAMPTSAKHSASENRLLNALPEDDYARLEPHLQRIEMPLGEVIYEPDVQLRHVYFPTTSIVSLLYVMADGASAEIAVVGNEGILGISLFMGGETTTSRAVVQSAGHGYRLNAKLLKEEFQRSGPMLHLLLRYTQALITQMAQTAVCNRHHSIDQQLCRWLLLSLDRLQSNELSMTQELIANMLGVRREGVTEAAGKLQDSGLIEYRRGRITVLDRPGLEARCCECYQVVKTECDRLLPFATAT
jgi:CRP-like cAMP-binding protein